MWTVKVKYTDGAQTIARYTLPAEAMTEMSNKVTAPGVLYVKISPPKS